MQYKINGYKPERVFRFFEEISAIPRGSGNERAISEYLMSFAKERGLECYSDSMYNVVIKKKASAGNEGKPAVMFQGHSDMVCEKNSNVEHDFETEGIKLIVENDTVHADGTTLGADNGIAVAYMLAILDDETLEHPAVECVITSQEEIGLNGAAALDGSLLQARMMINLDSEVEGIATVSCAGGSRYEWRKPIAWESAEGKPMLRLAVSGLLGGHSGADIHLERANANKMMGRILHNILKVSDGRIVNIEGGSKDNAIPRECVCVLAFESEADRKAASETARQIKKVIEEEIIADEPGFAFEIKDEAPDKVNAFSKQDTQDFSKLIYLAPDGARKRNVNNGGFIVASLNMGVIKTETQDITVVFAPRSSVASLQDEIVEKLDTLGGIFGFTSSQSGQYPGWKFAEVSKLRDVFCESFCGLFGKELQIEAIHAGLECGLFSDKLPGLDAIAVGPDMRFVHTPDEFLDLKSVERTWELLTDVLARLCK